LLGLGTGLWLVLACNQLGLGSGLTGQFANKLAVSRLADWSTRGLSYLVDSEFFKIA